MKYGLIGEKLGHSFSKPIHEKIADYSYETKEIEKAALDSFMKQRDFDGINVTIPYKTDVIPYLDYIDPIAEKIGAVNTIINCDGKLQGYNTDFGGLRLLIEKGGFDLKDKNVLILGSGGTSKTAEAVAQSLGAEKITKVSRQGEINYDNVYTLCSDTHFIINTTPVGMYPESQGCPVDIERFPLLSGVADVIYNPLKTKLCLKAEEKGIANINGLYMLVSQAVLACERFIGKKLDVKNISDEIYEGILGEKRNIVLIGMPGSGKSTIGKALAQKLGKQFIDTDDMMTSEYGVISDIFAEKGESYFRDIEALQVRKAAAMNGMVIATGGGAVLRRENVEALKQNGIIYFLNRPIEDIVPTADRPLSSDYEALKKRFDERYGIYVASADKEIFVDGVVENAVSKIVESSKQ